MTTTTEHRTVTVRLPVDLHEKLLAAVAHRKTRRSDVRTIQGIVVAALKSWLRVHGTRRG